MYMLALLSLNPFPLCSFFYNEWYPELWERLCLDQLLEAHEELKNNYLLTEGMLPGEKVIFFLLPAYRNGSFQEYAYRIFSPLLSQKRTVTIVVDAGLTDCSDISPSLTRLRSFLHQHVRLEKAQLLFCPPTEAFHSPKIPASFYSHASKLYQFFSQKQLSSFEAELMVCLKEIRRLELPTFLIGRLLEKILEGCIRCFPSVPKLSQLDVPLSVNGLFALSDSYASLYENLLSLFQGLFEAMLREEAALLDKTNTLMKIDRYIRENFTQPITTRSLSSLFGFTPAYLSQIFRDYKSLTPVDYITSLRIEKAKKLLRENPRLKVKDAAALVGYKDPLYFSKVFKKLTGTAPKQFVEKIQQSSGKD